MSKGLKALEIIKHTTDLDRTNELNGYHNEICDIEKELKALEIIKKTPQKVVFLCNSNDYEECLEMMNAFEVVFDFPKQEYDLLKEVLL